VTDGQTVGQTDGRAMAYTAYTRYSTYMLSRVKTGTPAIKEEWQHQFAAGLADIYISYGYVKDC